MLFSLFRITYVPVYTVFNINFAWIAQDRLLTNGIKANIETEPCTHADLCEGKESYSVCVSGRKATQAKALLEQYMQRQ